MSFDIKAEIPAVCCSAGIRCLFCFNLFLHVDELFVAVVKLILQERHLLRRYNMYSHAIFYLPFPFQGDESLAYIGGDIRVYVQIKLLYANLIDKLVNLTL